MSIREAILRSVLKVAQLVMEKTAEKPAPNRTLDHPIIELESERLIREAEARRKAGGNVNGK